MSFLRRILRGSDATGGPADPAGSGFGESAADEDEVERDRRLLREDAERLDHDLIQRQLRWADRAWAPPAQGGPRRAEDEDRDRGGGEG